MATKEFSYSDVSEHSSKKDLYLVVHDKVYNATSFVDEHPYVAFFNLTPLRFPTTPKYMLGPSTIVEEGTHTHDVLEQFCLAFSMFLSIDHLLTLQRSLQGW